MNKYLNKKDKLLFSFGSNRVKMRGFVESAQRKRFFVSGYSLRFLLFDRLISGGEPGKPDDFLKGFREW